MKTTWKILTLPLLILAALCGCTDPAGWWGVQSAQGGILLTIVQPAASARTAVPSSLDRTPESYDISGTGPGGTTFSVNSSLTSKQVDALAPGSWNVTVVGRNQAGTAVGSGSVTVTITAGTTTSVSVTITPITGGSGTLSVSLSWPSALVATPVISSTLTLKGGSPQTLTFSTPSGGSSTWQSAFVSPGAYVLIIDLKDGATVVCSLVEAVIVYRDLTTIAAFALDALQIKSPPAVPTGLTATAVSGVQINLAWTDTTIEQGYKIQHKEGSGGTWTDVATSLAANTVAFSDTGLSPSMQYFYRVAAYNSFGDSAWTDGTVNATTMSTCNLTVSPYGYGFTTPWGLVTGVTIGAPMGIVATADHNYHFVNWTLVSGSSVTFLPNANTASATVTPTGTAEIRANFAFNWTLSTVDSTGNLGQWSSLELYSSNPRISYYDVTNTALKYASYSGSAWATETVKNSYDEGQYSSLAIDSSTGFAKIAYHENNSNHYYSLLYSEWDGGNWNTSTLQAGDWNSSTMISNFKYGFYNSIALSGSYRYIGSHNLAYSNRVANYLYHNGTSWSGYSISMIQGGEYTSIAVSGTTIHSSFYDATNANLYYYYSSSPGSTNESTLDSTGDVGKWTSIAVDTGGKVHISYYDVTNGNLKYATNKSGSWAYSNVDYTGDVGSHTSLHLDSKQNPCISYYDSTNQDLKFSYFNGTLWISEIADSAGNVGQYTSLEVDSGDGIHISYYDLTNGDLKYAKRYPLSY